MAEPTRRTVSFTLDDVKAYLAQCPPLPEREPATLHELESWHTDTRWLDDQERADELEELVEAALHALRCALSAAPAAQNDPPIAIQVPDTVRS